MKTTIGDRIRGVLEKYPEIKRNRAKLRAIYYLSKDSEDRDVEWHTNHSQTDTCLMYYRRNKDGIRCDMEIMHMKALSEYEYKYETDDPRSLMGVKLDAVKLVFKDGKFNIAPKPE